VILVAVGTQFPFDRLVRTVDEWAAANGRSDVIAQVGPSAYQPRALKSFPFLDPEKFEQLQREADIIVSHAGMGSILTAMQYGKPIIIMPREFARGEHRNDHQKTTARRFSETPGVYVAMDEAALVAQLDRIENLAGSVNVSTKAPPAFTARLREFVTVP